MPHFQTSHAFIIGINDYQNLSTLQSAVNDAKELASILENDFSYQIHGPYLNSDFSEIGLVFQEMKELVKKGDRVLFYFAGHGIIEGDSENSQFLLLPADANRNGENSISMRDLDVVLQSMECQHFLMILDCCFSGAFKWTNELRDINMVPKKIYKERFDQYIIDPAWQVITSSAYDEKALDIFKERTVGNRGVLKEKDKEHSPFALALFQALSGEADLFPKGEGNGIITASELYTYIRGVISEINFEDRRVFNYSDRQTPSFFPLKKHDKGEFIFTLKKFKYNSLPSWEEELINPYKGLNTYQKEDNSIFYGRTRVVESLLGKVLQPQNNFLVITGVSGIGKSSLVRAGLLPELSNNSYKCENIFRIADLKASQLSSILMDQLDNPEKLENTVFFIDQFEEIITHCHDQTEREKLIDCLIQLVSLKHLNLKLICTIRNDFESQVAQWFPEKLWADARFVVPGFSSQELKEIIVQPAIQRVLLFDPPELVQTILDEIQQQQGVLPLLSFTLSELYEAYLKEKASKNTRFLTLENYTKLGGVIGSLRKKADDFYDNSTEEEKRVIRKLFLRMTSNTNAGLSKRRVFQKDLHFIGAKENKLVKDIISKLVNESRLLLTGIDEQTGEKFIEPVHDALITGWIKIREWIDHLGAEILDYTFNIEELSKKSQEVKMESEDKKKEEYVESTLFWDNDPRLEVVLELNKELPYWFTAKEKHFLKKSKEKREELIENLKEGKETAEVNLKVLQGRILSEEDATAGIQMIYDAQKIRKTQESRIAKEEVFYANLFKEKLAINVPSSSRGNYQVQYLFPFNWEDFIAIAGFEIIIINCREGVKDRWFLPLEDQGYIASADISVDRQYLAIGTSLHLVLVLDLINKKEIYRSELDSEITNLSFNVAYYLLLATGSFGALILDVINGGSKKIDSPYSDYIQEIESTGPVFTFGAFNTDEYNSSKILLSKGGKVTQYDMRDESIQVVLESGFESKYVFYFGSFIILSSPFGDLNLYKFYDGDPTMFVKSIELKTTNEINFILNSTKDTLAITGGKDILLLRKEKGIHDGNWEIDNSKINGFDSHSEAACFLTNTRFICTDRNFNYSFFECLLNIHCKYWEADPPSNYSIRNKYSFTFRDFLTVAVLAEREDGAKGIYLRAFNKDEKDSFINLPIEPEFFEIKYIEDSPKILMVIEESGCFFKVIDVESQKIEMEIDLGYISDLTSYDFKLFPMKAAIGDNYGNVKILKRQEDGNIIIEEKNFDHYEISSLKFNSKGTHLFVGAQNILILYNLSSKQQTILTEDKGNKSTLSNNREGRFLLSGAESVIGGRPSFVLWDLINKQKIHSFQISGKSGERYGVYSLKFLRNLNFISQDWEGFKIWDRNSKKMLFEIRFPKKTNDPAAYFDLPNGKTAALVHIDNKLFVYVIETADTGLAEIINN